MSSADWGSLHIRRPTLINASLHRQSIHGTQCQYDRDQSQLRRKIHDEEGMKISKEKKR
jgi:hypothetical protein